MREIKFRAWDKNFKTMYYSDHGYEYPGYIDLYNGEWEIRTVFESGDHGGDIPIKESDLMQYTGLKDKNGKEIYEGDLVKHNHSIFEIKWSDIMVCFIGRIINDKGMNWRDGDWFRRLRKHIKVIGNIYENPELLEKFDNE